MRKKYLVNLTGGERAELEAQFAGPVTLRQRNRVQVLLRADAGETDSDIADDLRRHPAHRRQRPPAVRRRRQCGRGLADLASPTEPR